MDDGARSAKNAPSLEWPWTANRGVTVADAAPGERSTAARATLGDEGRCIWGMAFAGPTRAERTRNMTQVLASNVVRTRSRNSEPLRTAETLAHDFAVTAVVRD